MNIGQVLTAKKDNVVRSWMTQVRQDEVIKSTQELTYTGILNSLPGLIDAIAHLLSDPDTDGLEVIVHNALNRGALRAVQGYDAEEIVREYAILRDVVFEHLEERLLSSKPLTLLRTTRLIDGTVDQVVAICLKHYTKERLQEVNLLYEEMMASNQELDRLVRNEQTNLAHLVHELKTPLTCIIGYSDLFLRQKNGGGESKLAFIEQVLSSGRQLLETINDTLEMSSYRAGQVVVDLTTVNVYDVVKETTIGLRTMAQQKGLTVGLDCPVKTAQIVSDRGRLRQVLINLIGNAVRYTENGSIRVSVRTLDDDDAFLEIAIADTGYGIDETDQSHIFEPYYQGKAGQQQASSTGLGLAIAHQMITLLRGSIRVKSQPGEGSTFTIVLPLQYDPCNTS